MTKTAGGFNPYFAYLKDLLKHKWWAYIECHRLGIPGLGIVHDLSKFSPAEFPLAARKYFAEQGEPDYPKAWLHHQKHNKHHWVYWVVYTPIPGYDWSPEWGCLPIPDRYRREMLADMRASSRRFGVPVGKWYRENRPKLLLHPDTRTWLEKEIGHYPERVVIAATTWQAGLDRLNSLATRYGAQRQGPHELRITTPSIDKHYSIVVVSHPWTIRGIHPSQIEVVGPGLVPAHAMKELHATGAEINRVYG